MRSHWILVPALAAVIIGMPLAASGQSAEVPGGSAGPSAAPRSSPQDADAGQQADDWDTGQLIDDLEALTAADLPRLQARAEGGDAFSQVLLGLAHEFGSAGLERRPSEGLSWFLKAAAQGSSWAEAWAADFYLNGAVGVERDLDRARSLYMSAAGRGDARAAFMVGQMYFFGDGVTADMPEAAMWFDRAARAGATVGGPMAELANLPCAAAFCNALRQVLGAMTSTSANRLLDTWDEPAREWHSSVTLPGTERCGFTSSDRTAAGEPQNFFCDTAVIDDETRGAAAAKEMAAEIAGMLPGYVRTDRDDVRPGPSTSFLREGYPPVRVTYNLTRGAAQHRVTVLVGQ